MLGRDWRAFRKMGGEPSQILHVMGFRTIPVDIFTLIRQLGIDLVINPDLPMDGQAYVPATYDEQPKIELSGRSADVRTRFTAAHELGHVMLHAPGQWHRDAVVSMASTRVEERQANRFAAELLMPEEHVFVEGMRLNGNVLQLAQRFNVSEPAMRIRMSEVFPL